MSIVKALTVFAAVISRAVLVGKIQVVPRYIVKHTAVEHIVTVYHDIPVFPHLTGIVEIHEYRAGVQLFAVEAMLKIILIIR